jgi:hypothetical protein
VVTTRRFIALENTRAAAVPRAAARRTFVSAAILPESFDVTLDLLLGDALGGELPGRLRDRRFESSAPHGERDPFVHTGPGLQITDHLASASNQD